MLQPVETVMANFVVTQESLSEELSTDMILTLQRLGYRVSGPLCKVICAACDRVAKEVKSRD